MHKLYKQQKDHRYFCGNRYEKYSIKKLKLGAASVLIGAGFLFGYNVDRVEADSVTEPTEAVVTKNSDTGLKLPQGNTQAKAVSESKVDNVGLAELAEKPNLPEEPEKSIEQVKPVKENEKILNMLQQVQRMLILQKELRQNHLLIYLCYKQN